MTRIESEKAIIEKPVAEIFNWFCNVNNYRQIMPEQVVDWLATENECSFTIKGMASLGMEIIEKAPDQVVKLAKKGKAPFDFFLSILVSEKGPSTSELQLVFDAGLNPILKMMAEKPLENFLNMLISNYRKISGVV